MGCDIHLHVEVQTARNWELVKPWWQCTYCEGRAITRDGVCFECRGQNVERSFYVARNYTLFGLLAGVRGIGPPITEPRGIPIDISWFLGDLWGEEKLDCHTPSWLRYSELREVENNPAWDFALEKLKMLADIFGPDRVRIVFWFDN